MKLIRNQTSHVRSKSFTARSEASKQKGTDTPGLEAREIKANVLLQKALDLHSWTLEQPTGAEERVWDWIQRSYGLNSLKGLYRGVL